MGMARSSCSVTFCVGAVIRHFQFWGSISVEVRECDCALRWPGKHGAFSVGAAAEKLQGEKAKSSRTFQAPSCGSAQWVFSILDMYLGELQRVRVHLSSSS